MNGSTDESNGVAGGSLVTGEVIESPADARQAARDAAMVRRLVNDPAWEMPAGCEKVLPQIMYGIAQRATATAATAQGPIEVDNHRAQIEATKTLLAMKGQNLADRHHAEGKKVNVDNTVRILVADARGVERSVGSMRELYANYPAALPAPVAPAAGPIEAEGGDGGAAGG